uniref:Small ribosomal subunit protein uS4c n=1 Tax=Selaginella lyallii TaxID=137159 RepID=A0A481ZL25_9TRAC|nr:ribosomal protein S4 [Selaginella lyallii]QBL02092.1 ribosomal protein S4 [Selaginella lyallii]
MSRYRGPRVKIVRRLGRLPGLTCKRGGKKPASTSQSVSAKKLSQYRIRLEEKQKLRFHYGLTEKQLLQYVRIARRAKGSTGQVLSQLLENRLDNIVFKLGMAPTIPGARQLVTHRHILVNGRVTSMPSYRCESADAIAMKPGHALGSNENYGPSSQIAGPTRSTGYPSSGSVGRLLVDRKWADLNVDELLVVEYYSRQA